ncbi:MAG: hypothetical protein HYT83_01305 [Candidatus Levybacteria bacterium]|nr:hypothetical protein [Candidatus Levybacteria bacterium]
MSRSISSPNEYLDKPCERCGSKKRISRRWKETVQTFNGTATIDCSQIICTNKVCQAEFDKNLLEETEKRRALKVKMDENKAARKANSLLQANKARRSKSRI